MKCPHCGARLDVNRAIATIGSQAVPRDGDLTICGGCGEWSAFSNGALGALSWEQTQYAAEDPDARMIRSAWLLAQQKPDPTLEEEWEDFRKATLKKIPANGLKLCRASFFAGAVAFYSLSRKATDEDDPAMTAAKLNRLCDEITEYIEHFREQNR